MRPMTYKTCPRCDNTMLADLSFHPDKSRKDGYRCYCNWCAKELHTEWRLRTGRTKKLADKPYRERT